MKMSWDKRTGPAKAASIFAILFLVSAGLCGANLALFSRFATISGGTPPPDRPVWASMTLISTAFIELLGMGIGALGLIVLGITVGVSALYKKLTAHEKDE